MQVTGSETGKGYGSVAPRCSICGFEGQGQGFTFEPGAPSMAHDCDTVLADQEEEVCPDCGGSPSNIVGCRACCRDCGCPCDQDTNDEGFHVHEEFDDGGWGQRGESYADWYTRRAESGWGE